MFGWSPKVYTGNVNKNSFSTTMFEKHPNLNLNKIFKYNYIFQATDESEASREDVEKQLRATDRQ